MLCLPCTALHCIPGTASVPVAFQRTNSRGFHCRPLVACLLPACCQLRLPRLRLTKFHELRADIRTKALEGCDLGYFARKGVSSARALFFSRNLASSPCSAPCTHAAWLDPYSLLTESVQFDFEVDQGRKVRHPIPPFQQLLQVKQQGITVTQYIRRFCTVVSQIPLAERPADHFLLGRFIDGLNYPVQIWEFLHRPKSCPAAILVAIEFETTLFDALANNHHKRHV